MRQRCELFHGKLLRGNLPRTMITIEWQLAVIRKITQRHRQKTGIDNFA
jgi:hypothetical protein